MPNDGGCVEDSDEDRMLFVFNRGGQADSNPVTSRGCGTSRDAAGTETHRALIMKAVDPGENAGSTFVRVWAREFRYDGPRQRYLARVLDPGTLYPLADQWTDYVGDAAVLDYRFEYFGSGDEVRLTGYLPGVSQTDLVADDTQYFHADYLGSTWYTSSKPAGDFEVTAAAVRTAFGETVNADWGIPESRYGYAGAHGYQEHDFASPADPGVPDGYTDAQFKASPTAGFPYMHLGARYYDPGSGRFLQRDPIGLEGGANVYEYVDSSPGQWIDPDGQAGVSGGAAVLTGALTAAELAEIMGLTAIAGTVAWNEMGGREAALDAAVTLAGLTCAHFAEHTKNKTRKNLEKHTKRDHDLKLQQGGEKKDKNGSMKWSRKGGKRTTCFVAGTLVWTTDGLLDIADLGHGDELILTYPTESLSMTQHIAETLRASTSELVEIHLSTESLRCTAEHPFWTSNRGWVAAGDLLFGDMLEDAEGDPIPVNQVVFIELITPIAVFNIEVDSDHMYYVGMSRVRVHNKSIQKPF